MLGQFIAGDFIEIAGEIRRFPASNENTEAALRYAVFTVVASSSKGRIVVQHSQFTRRLHKCIYL